MVRHMLDIRRLVSMRICFFIRGEYVTHMKFRAISGIFIVLGYVGQSELLRTYYELPLVWNTPGGSMCGICDLISKESNFTLIGLQ